VPPCAKMLNQIEPFVMKGFSSLVSPLNILSSGNSSITDRNDINSILKKHLASCPPMPVKKLEESA